MAGCITTCIPSPQNVVLHCRLAAAMKREKYEQRHMGNFKRIYPAAAASTQAKYERLLQGSARLFASSMKAKAYNTIGRIQVRCSCTLHITYRAR